MRSCNTIPCAEVRRQLLQQFNIEIGAGLVWATRDQVRELFAISPDSRLSSTTILIQKRTAPGLQRPWPCFQGSGEELTEWQAGARRWPHQEKQTPPNHGCVLGRGPTGIRSTLS